MVRPRLLRARLKSTVSRGDIASQSSACLVASPCAQTNTMLCSAQTNTKCSAQTNTKLCSAHIPPCLMRTLCRFGLAAYSSIASILLAASPPCIDRVGGSPLEAYLTRQRVIRREACASAASMGSTLVDEISGYCTGRTSDAPAVVIVDGVAGSGRTSATARAAERLGKCMPDDH